MKSNVITESIGPLKTQYFGDVLVAPATPDDGLVIYSIAGVLYSKNSLGVVTALGGGTGSSPALVYDVAPTGATYSTIQSAIDAALLIGEGVNALIRVFPGTYTENISLYSGMTLEGQNDAQPQRVSNGAPALVTLNGSITYLNSPSPALVRFFQIKGMVLPGNVSMIDGSVQTQLIFEGCTFPKTTVGGTNAAYDFESGGATGSFVQFKKCLLTGNLAAQNHIKIRIAGSMRAIFTDCRNPRTLDGTGGTVGKAVFSTGPSFMFIKDCEFESGAASGGLVTFDNPSSGYLLGCRIQNFNAGMAQGVGIGSASVGRVEISHCHVTAVVPISGLNNNVFGGSNTLYDINGLQVPFIVKKEFTPPYLMHTITLSVTTNLQTIFPYYHRHVVTTQVAPINITLHSNLDDLGRPNHQWISNRGTGNVTVLPPGGGTVVELVGVTLLAGESALYIYNPTSDLWVVASKLSAAGSSSDPHTSQTMKLFVDYTALNLAGPELILTFSPYLLVAASYLEFVSAYIVTPFDAVGLTSAILRIGDNTILDKYVSAFQLALAGGALTGDAQTFDQGFTPPSSNSVNMDITLVGATADQLIQGSYEVLLKVYDRAAAPVDFIPALT